MELNSSRYAEPVTRPRGYNNAARTEAARETRRRILEAAGRLLIDGGYPRMTITALSREAGVSPQTVYNAVGGKAEILKAAYDVMLAGTDDDIPMSQRPEFLAMRDSSDAATHARLYAAWSAAIYERVGPLLATVLTHAGADPALSAFAATIEGERRTGNTHLVRALAERHGLPPGLSQERAVDMVWALTAPEVADRLLRRRAWTAQQYERWLGDHLALSLT